MSTRKERGRERETKGDREKNLLLISRNQSHAVAERKMHAAFREAV